MITHHNGTELIKEEVITELIPISAKQAIRKTTIERIL